MAESNEHRPGNDPPAETPVPPSEQPAESSAPQIGRGHRAGRGQAAPDTAVLFGDRATRSPAERADSRRQRGRRRRRRRAISAVMVGAGALVLAGSLWVGWRSYQAYSHLQTASAEVSTLQGQIKDAAAEDRVATSATVQRLGDEAAAARSAVDDPVFRSATLLPLIGPNLNAIRDIAVSVDSLATDVMPSLVDIAETLQASQLAPANDSIDLQPIERISPMLQKADAAVRDARVTMAAIDRTTVLNPVGAAVVSLWRKLDEAAEVTEPAARITRLLPDMLGAAGPRTYLVAFQNPAEPRATGGIFGSFAVITADHGKIVIVDQGAASRTLGQFDPPAAELTAKEVDLYSAKMARFPQDVNLSPDFPTAARIFTEMYRQRSGTTVDGVLAIDPVALSYLLKGSPPIDVGDGVAITSDNLVPVLLSTAYAKFTEADQGERDAFLARATGKVFSEMMSGRGNARSILDGLRQAAGERRVLIYSADQTEQADIAATDIAGAIGQDAGPPAIGVFLNDATAAKLGYYLRDEVHVTAGECGADGRRELQVRVVMHSDAPTGKLPTYVTGTSKEGMAHVLQTNVLIFAPVGGGIVNTSERDGAPIPLSRGEDHSREVGWATVDLAPGASTELTFVVLGPIGRGGADDEVRPDLMLTPGVTPWVASVDSYRECPVPAA